MKGKIYKNKLNSTTANDHLNTEISSISPPLYSYNMQQPNSPGSLLLSPKTHSKTNNNNKNNNKKSFIHELFAETTSNNNISNRNSQNHGLNSFVEQLNQQFTSPSGYTTNHNFERNMNHIHSQINSPGTSTMNNNDRQNGGSLLKRALSNPNIASYQFLGVQENREEEIDPIDEASILDKSSHSHFSKIRPTINNNNHFQNNNHFNVLQNTRTKNNPIYPRPLSQLPSQQQFSATSPYNSPLYNQKIPPSPLLEASNFMYNNENSFLKPMHQLSHSQTDYITQYEKRHKQRVSALQAQHQLELQFYEEELKNKDETIEEMKRMLKQKEDIIKRLQSENANISSRSYISFANGNLCGKD